MIYSCDVLVVGAGPIGAAAVLGLLQQGRKVLWLAAQSPVADLPETLDLRVFAISAASRDLLEQLRVWPQLDAARVAPVYKMQIYPEAGLGGAALKLDAYEAKTEALAWIIEGHHLQARLTRALNTLGGQLVEARLEQMQWDARRSKMTAQLDNGSRIEAGVVIGADGAQSKVRELSGLSVQEKDYNKTALIEHFQVQRPHRDTAFQWFGPHGVLALLPLPGQRVSMVWSAPAALASELEALSAEQRALRVQEIAGETLGAMESISAVGAWPLRLLKLPRTSTAGVLLLGDAAHLVHPLAGQGMNLGFGDVQAMLSAFAKRPQGPSQLVPLGDETWLAAIARSRVEPVWKMQTVTDQLSRLFDGGSAQTPGLADLKHGFVRTGWSVMAQSASLRKLLVGAAN